MMKCINDVGVTGPPREISDKWCHGEIEWTGNSDDDNDVDSDEVDDDDDVHNLFRPFFLIFTY